MKRKVSTLEVNTKMVRVPNFAKEKYLPHLFPLIAHELGITKIHEPDLLMIIIREALEKRLPELAAELKAESGM